MKGPAIDQLVYSFMFPKPKATDPPNFQALLQRQIVPEVRFETQAFYGHLSSQEARYPGLDYSYQPHRVRLSRYPWHRHLFRAFDNLGLTHSEIASLTKWEGTRWAKERYEREQGVVIQDTTADGIVNWVEPELRDSPEQFHRQEVEEVDEMDSMMQDYQIAKGEQDDEGEVEIQMNENVDEESDSDIQSVGIALNERLRAAAAQHRAGNRSTVMDEAWEQWFKDAVEAGGLPFLSSDFFPRSTNPGIRPSTDSQSSLTSQLVNLTRLEQWRRFPEVLRGIVSHDAESTGVLNSNGNTSRRAWNFSRTAQHPLTSSATSSSMSRDASSSSFTGRSSNLSSTRRPNVNSITGMNSRMRHWESQRTGRTTSGARFAHMHAANVTRKNVRRYPEGPRRLKTPKPTLSCQNHQQGRPRHGTSSNGSNIWTSSLCFSHDLTDVSEAPLVSIFEDAGTIDLKHSEVMRDEIFHYSAR